MKRIVNIKKEHQNTKTLLCLSCRRQGHIASKCRNEPSDSEIGWFESDQRISMRFDDNTDESHDVCRRCEDLNILNWLETEPPITIDRDLSKMKGDLRLFQDLGEAGTIRLQYDCPLCRCNFGLTPTPSTDDQHVLLVLSWSMYRLEASIGVDTKAKRMTSKYVTVVLEPSSTSLSIEDLASTRGYRFCVASKWKRDHLNPLSVKEFDPRRIDIDSIRRWLTECDSLHSLTCKPQVSHNLGRIMLIDVEARRIVNYQSENGIYLTLSYVWGNGEQCVTGAGLPGTKLRTLPRTIEDALSFTKDLGMRYLWVDLVCIEQSDEAKKLEQIGIMSDIYQGAYATIIAFDGESADAGLARVRNTGTAYRQLRCDIQGTRLLGFGPTLSQLNWVLPWAQRAWTYQEAILSPRCIYISKFHVYMECNALTYCETLDSSQSPIHLAPHDKEFFKKETRLRQINTGVLRNPLSANINLEDNALRLYNLCTTIYTRRKLTKQSDALHAFSGILQALEKKTYQRGFFWALPSEDLNWALL